MIRSMTGFGRCEISDNNKKYTVEIKAVNHRYLELNTKLQKSLACFDVAVRNVAKEYAERGKVDIFVSMEDDGRLSGKVRYNKDIAVQYMNYLREMADEFGLENDVRLSNLSRYPDVFTMEDESLDEDEQWKSLEKCLRGAFENFVASRVEEGTNLKNDLLSKLDIMKKNVETIEERSPRIIEEYRKKITERIEELLAPTGAQIDEGRIITEVTIFADKVCVDEEIVRLKSHIESMRQCLEKGDSCGRKLDFIAQEMNREANTTLSKANDLFLSDTAIELKSVIEKIREQVQNIE
ncbi:MAG: YicC family protein [Lachnospiraceae bacterium]|nr:YicC family protein [Lachnospiraceae bacterium]